MSRTIGGKGRNATKIRAEIRGIEAEIEVNWNAAPHMFQGYRDERLRQSLRWARADLEAASSPLYTDASIRAVAHTRGVDVRITRHTNAAGTWPTYTARYAGQTRVTYNPRSAYNMVKGMGTDTENTV